MRRWPNWAADRWRSTAASTSTSASAERCRGGGRTTDALAESGSRAAASRTDRRCSTRREPPGDPRPFADRCPTDGQGSWAQKVLEYSLAQRYDMTSSSVYLSPAPLYHAAGVNYTMAVHRVGAASILMRKFDAETRSAADRDTPRHARPVRADHVRADAQAARGGPREVRRVEPAVRHPRRGAVSG